jgi:hypothetical protein
MSDTTLLALFEDIDPAAEAIDKLHEMGVTNDRLNVISGIPDHAQDAWTPAPVDERFAAGAGRCGCRFLLWDSS